MLHHNHVKSLQVLFNISILFISDTDFKFQNNSISKSRMKSRRQGGSDAGVQIVRRGADDDANEDSVLI
jgi:hypothetical protein